MSFEMRFTAGWLVALASVVVLCRLVNPDVFQLGAFGAPVLAGLLILFACAMHHWVKTAFARQLQDLARTVVDLLSDASIQPLCEKKAAGDIQGLQNALAKLRPILIEHRKAISRLEHRVRHDHLTGANNRLHFDECLARATEKKTPLSLILVDVDRFKNINDTFGHGGGDAVLKRLADLLKSCAGSNAIVSRVGGDEFAILAPESTAHHARQLASSILEALGRCEGVLANVRVSMGAASFPDNCADNHALRESADLALYHAKATGRGRVCVFGDQGVIDRRRSRRSTLMSELDSAIDTGQLLLHYQPKMCSRTNKIDSVEALIRWEHPVHGMLPPNDFIIAAEESGRIERLSEWTLRQAVADQISFAEHGVDASIYVNISGPLLGAPKFIESILETVGGHEQRIGLEITETAVIEDPENALKHLHLLVDAGLRVAIDDYGVGLSSLTYLKQLPAHELKIDRAFISDLTRTHRDPLLVRSTIDLAHALGMKVTAEGVEEASALALLRVMGCDFVQGYLIAKPMPLRQLLAFMTDADRDGFALSLGIQDELIAAK